VRRRRIGSGGFEVGAVGLGCMPLTGGYGRHDLDGEAAVTVVHRALEDGVTLLDTADVYGPFTNEMLLARAMKERRNEVVVATKCGLAHSADHRQVRNGRPEYVRRACDASLRRLGVEAIDLYHLHRVDPEVPLEETWGAMAELVRAGKVRSLGICEVGTDLLARAQRVFPVTAVQSELSLWSRKPLESVLPWCTERGVGFLAYGPLGRGFLADAVPARPQGVDDLRARLPRFAPSALESNRPILAGVRRVAERHGASPAQVALAWVQAQGPTVVPIPGTANLSHLAENTAADALRLQAEDLIELDALPAAVGDRR
jgi:aryl-alcohol dehydrogenase-like predicted oxidoreductase